MCKMKYNRLLWKDHSRRYSTTYKAEIILFISSSIQSSISVWFLKKDFVILLQESSALEEQMKNTAEVADLMSYSSSSIPMMFFFPSLIGSLFLLAINNQPPVILILFYHSLLTFYRLFSEAPFICRSGFIIYILPDFWVFVDCSFSITLHCYISAALLREIL